MYFNKKITKKRTKIQILNGKFNLREDLITNCYRPVPSARPHFR
jgi:hypothetical protein